MQKKSKELVDTIVAAATPPGKGGVAVVRVSGPAVSLISQAILGKTTNPRDATYARFLDTNQNAIDEGIAIYFPAPHSFTGEDVLEIQGHGGPVVVDQLIRRLLELGARYARPGEFSERAFLNGKMDLAQAEAIADLIDASSTQAATAALRSLQGEFSKKIYQLVDALIRLRMYVEAAIDFVEEEIDFLADKQITTDLQKIILDVQTIQAQALQGSLLREGITAVIAGKPNVGKSSLLNQLSGKDSAIVTDIPGTTRDLLREYILIDGLPMHIIDTAGLRESNDPVEQEGIRRAKDAIKKADLVLRVLDATDNQAFEIHDMPEHAIFITVRNKIDLVNETAELIKSDNAITLSLSAKNGDGIDLLRETIKSCVGYQSQSEGIFSARRRHLDALKRAEDFLIMGQTQLSNYKAGELLAEDLRQAQLALSEITGEFTADDLLGKIFSNFCVGK